MRILLTVLLLAAAQSIGNWAKDYHFRYKPDLEFVARELDGKSSSAGFHRGRALFDAGDYARARPELERAVAEVERPENRQQARFMLGMSALQTGDVEAAIDSLERLPPIVLGPQAGLILVEAQLASGRRAEGFMTLDALDRAFGRMPEFAAARAQLEERYPR